MDYLCHYTWWLDCRHTGNAGICHWSDHSSDGAGLLEDWVNERLEAKNIDMPIVKNEKVREAKEEMKEKEESK